MSGARVVGALLIASPFVALAGMWVRDFGWADFFRHLAALVGLFAVIGVGLLLVTGVPS